MKTLLTLGACLSVMISCTPSHVCESASKVTVIEGVDGCGLLFLKEDNSVLNPINRDSLALKPELGKIYNISYNIKTEAMSICMSGVNVEVTCISAYKLP